QGTLAIGNYIYMIGGRTATARNASVQRAIVHADGTTSSFETVGATLVEARAGFVTLVTPAWVYVVGGDDGTSLDSVERAPIAAAASLEPFPTGPSLKLTIPREYAASAVIGPYLYVFGGTSSMPTASVERAATLPDGPLGAFTAVTGSDLAMPRADMTATVIGNYVYIISGWTGGSCFTPSVERADIHPDGSLGAFAVVAGVTLVTARTNHTATVYGGHVYIVGGLPGSNFVTRVERATIHADGTIDTFVEIPVDLAAE